jgi:vacuolar-type H+-ATPase subunit H
MRDVIQKIVATEAEAGRIVTAASKQAQELVATARLTARPDAEKLPTRVSQAAEAEKQTRLACSAAEIEAVVIIDEVTV